MILFVDDDKRRMESIVEALEMSGYEVCFQENVDAALQYWERNKTQIRLLILDIMMSPGRNFSLEETGNGLRTGVSFYLKIRLQAPALRIVILSNVTDPRVIEKFGKDDYCEYWQKKDHLPFDIVNKVKSILPDAKDEN